MKNCRFTRKNITWNYFQLSTEDLIYSLVTIQHIVVKLNIFYYLHIFSHGFISIDLI